MEIIRLLGGAMGLSFVAGINLYATVLAVGLGINSGFIKLAPGMEPLEILGHPLIIVIACAMYALEFFADKVPWLDTTWDTVHTFIRPVGGALLASAAVGQVDPTLEFAAILLGGGIAFSTHATKASFRMLVNQSPEPFSNSVVSVAEDAVAIAGTWLALQHPGVTIGLVTLALALMSFLAPKTFRVVRVEFALLGTLLRNLVGGRGDGWDALPAKYRGALPAGFKPSQADFRLRAVSGGGTALPRNLLGVLCMQGDQVAFCTRSWFRATHAAVDVSSIEDAWLETGWFFHRLSLHTDAGVVRFRFFRDRSQRAERAVDFLQARPGAVPAATASPGEALAALGFAERGAAS